MRTIAHEAEALATSDDEAEHETGETGADVHDVATCEVEGTDHVADEASVAAPDHVGQRCIDERYPKDHEQDEGAELHAAGDGTRDDGRRDHGEGELEADVHDGGIVEPLAVDAFLGEHVRHGAEAADLVDAAEERQGAVPAIGKGPSEQNPDDADDTDDAKDHHHRVDDVLAPGEATVEEGQPRRHEEHQHGAYDHECSCSRIKHENPPFLSS